MDKKQFKEDVISPMMGRFTKLTEKINKAFQDVGNEEYAQEMAKLGRTPEDGQEGAPVAVSKPKKKGKKK